MGEIPYNVLEPSPEERDRGSGLRSSDLLRAFTAISRALNIGQPLSLILDLIAEKVSQTMGHKYCAVYLFKPDTGELILEGAHGLSEEYVEALNTDLVQRVDGDDARANSVSAVAFRSQMPIHVEDVTSDPRHELWSEAALEAGYSSSVSLPLIFRCESIGVLNCYDEPRTYSEEQVEALMAVAEQTASAIGMARLTLEQQHTIDQLDARNRQVVAQHALLRRSEDIHEVLTTALLEDRSLQEITAAFSKLLRSPIVLQDEQLNVLSRATVAGKAYSGIPSDAESRRWVEPSITELREARRARKIEPKAGSDSGSRLVATRVAAGKDVYGFLSMLLESDSEEELRLRALEQAATVYALYMMKQRSAQDAEVRVKGNLLGDLVTGRFQDEDDVREWSGYLKLDFASSPYRIIVAKPATSRPIAGQERQDPRGFERIRGKLVGLIRDFSCRFGLGAAVAIDDHVVGLFPLRESEDPHEVAEHLLKLAHKEVPDLPVRLGISDVCLRPLDISKRYQEIVALVDLANRLEVPSQTLCYDDWKVYGLLVKASDQEDVSKLARETLYPILQQDQGGQLLTTLQAYIENGLNMSRTATTLYVHPNTVKYRLRRISELLDVNLDNLDDVLTIKIALMIKSLAPESFDPANF